MIDYACHYVEGIRRSGASTIDEAGALAQEDSGFVLLALNEPDAEELKQAATAFDLPALAAQDGLMSHRRPMLEHHRNHIFVVVKSVRYDETTPQMAIDEYDVFVGSSYAIVIGRSTRTVIDRIRARLDEDPDVAALGPMAALGALLDAVISDVERVGEVLADDTERIEQTVFEGSSDQSEAIYLHLRRVDHVIRSVYPLVPIIDTLERGETVGVPEGLRPLMGEVGDHAGVLSGALRQLSDHLDGLLDVNLARVGVRQNETTQKMSAWAAIIAVPTIITGIYGMNFDTFPELRWPFGYPIALGIMLVIVLVLRWNFKRIGWL